MFPKPEEETLGSFTGTLISKMCRWLCVLTFWVGSGKPHSALLWMNDQWADSKCRTHPYLPEWLLPFRIRSSASVHSKAPNRSRRCLNVSWPACSHFDSGVICVTQSKEQRILLCFLDLSGSITVPSIPFCLFCYYWKSFLAYDR